MTCLIFSLFLPTRILLPAFIPSGRSVLSLATKTGIFREELPLECHLNLLKLKKNYPSNKQTQYS